MAGVERTLYVGAGRPCPARRKIHTASHSIMRPTPQTLWAGAAACPHGFVVRNTGWNIERGEQAQRGDGGPVACFGRYLLRNAG